MDAVADSLIDGLRQRYNEPHRSYHTQAHIDALLRWADVLRADIADFKAVHWAIWYHDAIYDPQAKDNEERSAQLAEVELGHAGLPAEKVAHIAAMIRATAHHMATAAQGDMALFLDMDLSILGVTPEYYERYVQQVRAEYAWVSDAQFAQGRAQLVAQWLDEPSLFKTAYFQQRLEVPARSNLSAEWGKLRKSIDFSLLNR